MADWPHGPSHRISGRGVYIVTAGTYAREPVFGSRSRLTLLCDTLFQVARERNWNLGAWAVFPNHYHFVADSLAPGSLRDMIRHLHSLTARAANRFDRQPGRRVWFQYWETRLTNQRSYFARLHYVHENAVRHGIVRHASNYPWCSAGWFERKATSSFRNTVLSFPCDRVSIADDFEVAVADCAKP
jgi:REP-associated tyrosine transposase